MARPAIPALTSMRFLAATAVVLFHTDHARLSFPFGLQSFGYEAVTFFFVLSGFILTYVHATEECASGIDVDWRSFVVARIARIWPAYLLALAISAPFLVYSFFVVSMIDAKQFLASLVLVPLLAQSWYPPTALSWNIPAWSLSVEIFFYLTFPLLMRSTRTLPAAAVLVAAYFGACAVDMGRSVVPVVSGASDFAWWHSFYYYFPMFHWPLFIFGAGLGRLYLFGRKFQKGTHEVALICAFVLVGIVIACKARHNWLSSNAVLAIVFGLLIFGAAGAAGPVSTWLTRQAAVLLGEASYAMYIMHMPILMWWSRLTEKFVQPNLSALASFVVYYLLVVAVSIAINKFVEKPMRREILRRFSAPALPART